MSWQGFGSSLNTVWQCAGCEALFFSTNSLVPTLARINQRAAIRNRVTRRVAHDSDLVHDDAGGQRPGG